jgi:hypothetical protein
VQTGSLTLQDGVNPELVVELEPASTDFSSNDAAVPRTIIQQIKIRTQ